MFDFAVGIVKAVEGTVEKVGTNVERTIRAGRPDIIQEGETQEAYEARLKFLAEERERKRQAKLEGKKLKAEVAIAKAEQKTLERQARQEFKIAAKQAKEERREAKRETKIQQRQARQEFRIAAKKTKEERREAKRETKIQQRQARQEFRIAAKQAKDN